MPRLLHRGFFDRPVVPVAKDLLGKFLVRRARGRELALMITEVEAYDGPDDEACHAHRGRTSRNRPMFGPPGRWYVYFIYGMHWMLNVVTGPKGYPAAILVRGLVGTPGPARLTKRLGIDGRLSGRPARPATGLWIEDRGVLVPPARIATGPRVGIDYAGAIWRKKPWRFTLGRDVRRARSAADGRDQDPGLRRLRR